MDLGGCRVPPGNPCCIAQAATFKVPQRPVTIFIQFPPSYAEAAVLHSMHNSCGMQARD